MFWIYSFFFINSWSPLCDMPANYPEKADQTAIAGSLELVGFHHPAAATNLLARMPGNSFDYQCSAGFGLAPLGRTNPLQQLKCSVGRTVLGLDDILQCIRKLKQVRKLRWSVAFVILQNPN